MVNANDARNALTAGIAALSTEQIYEAVRAIGGGYVDTDQRMVRAYLIEELITRDGDQAGNALMDEVGL